MAQLDASIEADGWEAVRRSDLEIELAGSLTDAATNDPFRDRGSSRQLSDRIIIVAGELAAWTVAIDWVVRGYYVRGYFVRPGRLIRVLTDLPFDRRGLASDPRYARLLRTAGLEFLL